MKLGKRLKSILPFLFFFLLAFSLRIYQLGFDVINIDASFWKENTYNFMGLLFKGRFADMAVTHHPGVTLMWLGGLAMKAFRGVYYFINGVTAPDTRLAYLWTHFAQKLPIAVITSLFVVFVYWSVQKLFNKRVAFISAFLLALEPLFLAHSRVFHLDALLSVFMVGSVLFLLVYLKVSDLPAGEAGLVPAQVMWIILSAIFAALALLTKSTALFLFPYVALTLAVFVLRDWLSGSPDNGKFTFQQAIIPFLLWLFITAIVFTILWPSMWVQPLQTVKLYFSGITTEANCTDPELFASSRHVIFGNQTYNPAWYYYPLVLAYRLSPVVLVFAFVGVVIGLVREFRGGKEMLGNGQRAPTRGRPYVLYLFLYLFFFLVMISIPAKKLDRYILPILPIFCIFAGYGISQLLNRLKVQRFLPHLLISLFAVRLVTFIPLHPDYGFYFSPLLGGAKAGLQFDSDYWWGEGYKEAADYLNNKPGAENLIVGTFDDRSFKPFFKGTAHDLGADYDQPEDYWIRSPDQKYEGYQLEKVIQIGNYELFGIYKKVEDGCGGD